MKLYYRISDKSYEKNKLIGTTKEVCLMNFCKAFASVIFGEGPPSEDHVPPIKVICDNCDRKTIKMVQQTGLPHVVTAEGNAGSLRLALDLAFEECEDNELVYFCEDDYLHLGSAPKLLEEGIRRTDYVTLYDHPDKYSRYYNGGEYSKVIRTASSHWRYTASTCMTFGAKVKTLREDREVWDEFTAETHPHDHYLFSKLGENNRRVAVCIPGVACHTDLTFSEKIGVMQVDQWAIELMCDHIEREMADMVQANPFRAGEYAELKKSMVIDKTGQERLMALDAMRQVFK